MIRVMREHKTAAGDPRSSRRQSRRLSLTGIVGGLLILLSVSACRREVKEPVTLTFLDPQWSHDLTQKNVLPDPRLQAFTRETGISVKHLPAPETALDQLDLVRELLRKGTSGPDVSGVDVVWPGTLGEDLIDLRPNFAKELASVDPHVIESFTVNGRLVAIPYHPDAGVLFYRKDLLRKYGYDSPPKTWDELEKMALKIQQGERAKGQKDFWGFVWPGAAGEGLTCNALEWQMGEGGGRIIEADNTISVNNPEAIRSWQRAAHWIGWISPPSVSSYEEWDAIYNFYLGRGAFYRGWVQSYFMSVGDNPWNRGWIGITSVPGGKVAQVATVGGYGLGVSRSAAHPVEAMELARFLVAHELQAESAASNSEPAKRLGPYEQLALLKTYSDSAAIGGKLVSRPSSVSGTRYADVSRAYNRAVHSVLIGKTGASEAAASLERQLAQMTGFKTGPPIRARSTGK